MCVCVCVCVCVCDDLQSSALLARDIFTLFEWSANFADNQCNEELNAVTLYFYDCTSLSMVEKLILKLK